MLLRWKRMNKSISSLRSVRYSLGKRCWWKKHCCWSVVGEIRWNKWNILDACTTLRVLNMRISPSCLNNLTINTSEATKLYLTVFDKKKKKTLCTFQNLLAVCFGNFWRRLDGQLINNYSARAKWILWSNPREVTSTTLTKRVVAILKLSAPATITSREVLIARHDVIRDQSDHMHLYSHRSNYTDL